MEQLNKSDKSSDEPMLGKGISLKEIDIRKTTGNVSLLVGVPHVAIDITNNDDMVRMSLIDFCEKHLPKVYYRRMVKSRRYEIMFRRKPNYHQFTFFDIYSDASKKKLLKEGYLSNVQKKVDFIAKLNTFVQLPFQFADVVRHIRNNKVTIREIVDVAISLMDCFCTVVLAALEGGKAILKSNCKWLKQAVKSVTAYLAKKGIVACSARLLGCLCSFLNVIGDCILVWDLSVKFGNFLRGIKIKSKTVGEFIDEEIDEFYNRPFEWAKNQYGLAWPFVMAILMAAYKGVIDLSVQARGSAIVKLSPRDERIMFEWRLRHRKMYMTAAPPKYEIWSAGSK